MTDTAEAAMQPAMIETKSEMPAPAQAPATSSDTEQVIFTMNAGTGEIVKIEKIDKTGSRGDISTEECRKFTGGDEFDEIDLAFDAAFEIAAAILDAIGDSFLDRSIVLRLLGRRIAATHVR